MQPASDTTLRVLRIGAHALFVLLLGIGVVRALPDAAHPVLVALAALAVLAWYSTGGWFAHHPDLGRMWLTVLVLGWTCLAVLDADFVWVAFPLYFLCFHLCRTRVAVVVAVAITAVAIASSLWHGSANPTASVLGPLIGAVAASGMAVVFEQLVDNARQRTVLYDELARAHQDLVDAQGELAAVQRDAGAAAERARLARDIHDTLAQGFSSIVLLARAGRRANASAALVQIEETAKENLDEARRVVGALTPAVIDGTSLAAALERVAARLREQSGIEATVVVDGEPVSVPMDHDVALLRIAQSALANVRLHSGAARVRVTLTYGSDEVRLDVADDGVGFDPAAGDGSSFGFRAMRERLDSLGGSLVVESAPGEGTALAATLPVSM